MDPWESSRLLRPLLEGTSSGTLQDPSERRRLSRTSHCFVIWGTSPTWVKRRSRSRRCGVFQRNAGAWIRSQWVRSPVMLLFFLAGIVGGVHELDVARPVPVAEQHGVGLGVAPVWGLGLEGDRTS